MPDCGPGGEPWPADLGKSLRADTAHGSSASIKGAPSDRQRKYHNQTINGSLREAQPFLNPGYPI
ncbi:MAG TPA: hypothetical protein VMD58_10635 [Acidobacteriaceae bacterium]|nr:hypothetical protein [Acidobacteriaceae bacterium]